MERQSFQASSPPADGFGMGSQEAASGSHQMVQWRSARAAAFGGESVRKAEPHALRQWGGRIGEVREKYAGAILVF